MHLTGSNPILMTRKTCWVCVHVYPKSQQHREMEKGLKREHDPLLGAFSSSLHPPQPHFSVSFWQVHVPSGNKKQTHKTVSLPVADLGLTFWSLDCSFYLLTRVRDKMTGTTSAVTFLNLYCHSRAN